MKLHGTPYSTFTRRVRVALIEKGLDHELVEAGPDVRTTPAYRALNPFGRIPTLEHEGHVLYESTAILTYLEERFPTPPLVPSDPAGRARVAMLTKLCDLELSPHAVLVQRPKRLLPEAQWDREAMARAREPIAAHYAFLERELDGREWLAGDAFTHADIAYLPFLHFHGLLDVALPPRVDGWWQRIDARESVRATVPAK